MLAEAAITVENICKCYEIYDKPHHRLLQMLWHGRRKYYRDFWALKDVSISVQKGETVGIIGKNGCGKSTLLQILCGTLNPTSGQVMTNGRIAALLELGSGFNREFTGRENVFMNAAILGLSQKEIENRFDDIVAFADIGDFIDQPVKMYSSGMYVRLAFAVVINVDPDILIIDEALTVGDEKFVRKCFSRLEAIRDSGATIFFVSHSGSNIIQLCNRAMLIDAGERLFTGEPKIVYGHYQRLLYAEGPRRESIRNEIRDMDRNDDIPSMTALSERVTEQTAEESIVKRHEQNEQRGEYKGQIVLCKETAEAQLEQIERRELFDPNLVPSSTITYESQGAIIKNPGIFTLDGKPANHLLRGRWYRYIYQVEFFQDANHVRFGMLIKTKTGLELGGAASTSASAGGLLKVYAGSVYKVEFEFLCLLNEGTYFMNVGVMGVIDGTELYLYRLLDAVMFKVQPEVKKTMTGLVDFQCQPKVQLLSS